MQSSMGAPDQRSRLRILVVGESRVGKTLFIRRLCHDIFARDGGTSYFDAKWGSTIGFYVDVLVRDAMIQAPTPPTINAHISRASSLVPPENNNVPTRNRRHGPSFSFDSEAGNNNNNNNSATTTSVVQTVEFHELGGGRCFMGGGRLPLQRIRYDGIIFMYERSDAPSAIYLSWWYEQMGEILRGGVADGGGTASPFSTPHRMPKIMLVGTQLQPSMAMAPLISMHSRSSSSFNIPDEAFVGRGLLTAQHTRASSFFQRGHGGAHAARWLRWRAWLRCLVGRLCAWWAVLAYFFSPSQLLSVQHAEDGCSTSSHKLRQVQARWAQYALLLQRCVSLAVAVILFGPSRVDGFRVQQPTVREALDRIREDEDFITQVHTCELYDSAAMEVCLPEVLHFLDFLHVSKLQSGGDG